VTRVFVTDGAERTSLAIARSLGRAGIEVHCGESHRFSTTALSKYCKKSFIYPDPQADCRRFIAWLEEILSSNDYDAIYSSREVTTVPISYHKKRLEAYTRVPFPDYPLLLMAHDKGKTFQFAKMCGIPIPETYVPEDPRDLEGIARSLEYPAVVKSRRKTIWKGNSPSMLKVTERNYVHSPEELLQISQEIERRSGIMPIVQEFIPGEGFGVEVLMNNGDPRAIFMHRRLREYPITGGASTLRESIADQEMQDVALRLMKRLRWHGVAMVEFKRDDRDGMPKLMEINGRFWGSLPLSIAAGVDFPYLLHQMVMRGDVKPAMEYHLGTKCRWLMPGDMLWLLASLKEGEDRTGAIREFLKFRGIHDDILSADDPLPAAGAMRDMVFQMGKVITKQRTISGEVRGKDE
jgi:predicted ATP-grasp superfamily ATP-dependent carboligase